MIAIRPRSMLVFFGFLVTLISFIALTELGSITGFSVISNQVNNIINTPDNPSPYFVVLGIIGLISIFMGIRFRKVMY